MNLYRKSVLIGVSFAVTFLALGWSGILAKLLWPFTKESSIHAGTVAGILIVAIIVPSFAILAALTSAVAAPKTKRLSAAGLAILSSLVVMGAGLIIAEHTQKTAVPIVPTNIFIANPIETGKQIEIEIGSPFVLRAYARNGSSLADDSLRAELMVFVPGTIERKIVASTSLHATGASTESGLLIYEGSLTISDSHGATSGFLSVFGGREKAAAPNVARESVVIRTSAP